MIELPRRRFLSLLTGIVAAPAIVRASSLMPIKAVQPADVYEAADMHAGDYGRLGLENLEDLIYRISPTSMPFAGLMKLHQQGGA